MAWGVDYNFTSRSQEGSKLEDPYIFYCSNNGKVHRIKKLRIYLSGSMICVACATDNDDTGCFGDSAIKFIYSNKERVLFVAPDGDSMQTFISLKGTHPVLMIVSSPFAPL